MTQRNINIGTAEQTGDGESIRSAFSKIEDNFTELYTDVAANAQAAIEVNDLTSSVTWANVPDTNITQSSVTQHQASLALTASQVSDFASAVQANEINDLTGAVTWANVPDTNITESSVTQHQAALSITLSQISDIGNNVFLTDIQNESIGDLSDVDLTGIANGSILSWNSTSGNFEIAPIGIQLTSLSVTAPASAFGSGGVDYNNVSGEFTYTPPNLSTFLTAESDSLATVTSRGATTTDTVEFQSGVIATAVSSSNTALHSIGFDEANPMGIGSTVGITIVGGAGAPINIGTSPSGTVTIGSGSNTIDYAPGTTVDFTGATILGLSGIPAIAFADLSTTPTTIAGYGITDAFDGDYTNLTNKPTLFDGDYTNLTNKPTLFDGAFASLTGKPTTVAGYGITDAFDGATSSLTGNIDLTTQVTGTLPIGNMAAVALTTVQTAADETAHLALTAEEGDVVVRSDENKTYIHNGGSAGTMADYTLLATPTDSVTSVDGNTGAVTTLQIGTTNTTALAGDTTFAFSEITSTPTTIAGYGITDAFDGAFASLTSKPTTIAGYGITDALELGTSSTTALAGDTALFDGAFGSLSGTPTTIAGYGITDAFDGEFSSLANTPTTISGYGITDAFDGAFGSLSGTPTTVAGYGITDAFDGDYTNLTNQPTLFDGAYSSLSGTPTMYANSDVDSHLNQSNPTSGYVLSWNGSDYAWVAQSGGGGTFALAGNTGTHTFNTATETLTFLGTTGQINAGIASNNVTLELDPNINSIVSISFEGSTADEFETKLQATDPTADRTINLPDADGTLALTSDIPTAYTDSDVDTHLNQSSAGSNEVLSWDGADYAWVAQSGGGAQSRGSVTGTTSSLADAAEADLDITGFKSYMLLTITTDRAARVRLYVSAATRTADASRAEGVDPTSDAGLIAEVITTGADTVIISPGAYGFNLESSPTTNIPCRVTNKSGSTSTVQVDLNILQLEA